MINIVFQIPFSRHIPYAFHIGSSVRVNTQPSRCVWHTTTTTITNHLYMPVYVWQIGWLICGWSHARVLAPNNTTYTAENLLILLLSRSPRVAGRSLRTLSCSFLGPTRNVCTLVCARKIRARKHTFTLTRKHTPSVREPSRTHKQTRQTYCSAITHSAVTSSKNLRE